MEEFAHRRADLRLPLRTLKEPGRGTGDLGTRRDSRVAATADPPPCTLCLFSELRMILSVSLFDLCSFLFSTACSGSLLRVLCWNSLLISDLCYYKYKKMEVHGIFRSSMSLSRAGVQKAGTFLTCEWYYCWWYYLVTHHGYNNRWLITALNYGKPTASRRALFWETVPKSAEFLIWQSESYTDTVCLWKSKNTYDLTEVESVCVNSFYSFIWSLVFFLLLGWLQSSLNSCIQRSPFPSQGITDFYSSPFY